MASSNNRERCLQLKEQLGECKKFIQTAQREAERDLAECQRDYQDACKELNKTKAEYQKELKRAALENFSPQQVQTMEKMFQEAIASDEKYKDEMFGYLEDAQKFMKELPKLLEQAKAEARSLEDQLALYEPNTASTWQIIGGVVIWAIIIFLIFKACGG